jgi:hypothetical protein
VPTVKPQRLLFAEKDVVPYKWSSQTLGATPPLGVAAGMCFLQRSHLP